MDYIDTEMGGRIPSGLPGGFFIYEAEGDETILFAETNVVNMYGCDSFDEFMEYVGGSFKGMVHPDDLHKVENQIQAQTIFSEKHWKNGKSFYYVFIIDVDQNEFFNRNRNSYAEAEILSANNETDPLTGLLNMSFFYQKVQGMITAPGARRMSISFVHFNIPNFKLYNERNGFKLGDELLCDLAKAIHDAFEDAAVARFSDDNFFVCAVDTRDNTLAKVDAVYKSMLLSDDVNKKIRIKAGVYFLDDKYAEVGLSCDHARLACNSIKGRHDVNYCVYDEMLRDKMRRQQYVVDHIDEAIEKDYIQVFYQPVIRVATGDICGYEALVRWVDPQYGTLRPADFVETLEQFHLIHMLDQHVINRVCMDYKALADAGEPLVPISINISRLDFELCHIFGIVEQTCNEYGVPREMLDLEITESALNENVEYIKSECNRMISLGYHIWLDDFGSGYSSLNTMVEYKFDVLKLDLIFLRNLEKYPKTSTLMTFIVEGAKGLGLSPLCEGVETKEQYEFLKKIGCERAQGFYFGKAMPMKETRAFTAEKGMKWESV